jgi:hypothetical protein
MAPRWKSLREAQDGGSLWTIEQPFRSRNLIVAKAREYRLPAATGLIVTEM